MICGVCKEAGKLNKAGEDTPFVEHLHGLCKGYAWCDCQHLLGSALGTDMM